MRGGSETVELYILSRAGQPQAWETPTGQTVCRVPRANEHAAPLGMHRKCRRARRTRGACKIGRSQPGRQISA